MKIPISFLVACLSLGLLAGCSSFDPRQMPSAKGVWEFGSLVGETPGTFKIHRGTSRADILNLLGEPKSKSLAGKDGTNEVWTYVRVIESGIETRGASMGAIVSQRARWVETSRITFVGEVVQDITMSRDPFIKREGNTPY